MTSLYEILKASKTGIASDLLTALRGRQYAASLIQERELEGVPPLLFKANGEPLIDWSIYGNTVQNGTPTPDNPVMPNGCGERTKNLIDYKAIFSQFIDGNGDISGRVSQIRKWVNFKAEDIGKTLTLSFYAKSVSTSYIRVQAQINGEYVTGDNIVAGSTGYSTITITPTSTDDVWRITYGNDAEIVVNQVMLEESSTRTTYEPYGYKLTISSANTTTPVYLGEVETMRKIKKYEFTGEETINLRAEFANATAYSYTHYTDEALPYNAVPVICSHFPFLASYGDQSDHIYQDARNFYITSTQYHTVEDFKTFLQQQYANGTPVTVWYVLATEETAVVNEPLQKIGDYADSLTATQAGVEIPTIKGNNTLDIDTTVKPSKVYIKYKG